MDKPKRGDLVQHIKSKRTMFVFQVFADGWLDLRKHGQPRRRGNPRNWRVVPRLEVQREPA